MDYECGLSYDHEQNIQNTSPPRDILVAEASFELSTSHATGRCYHVGLQDRGDRPIGVFISPAIAGLVEHVTFVKSSIDFVSLAIH